MITVVHTANFGKIKTGLSVGYTIYKEDRSVYQSRTTSGVGELGSTGIYTAKIIADDSLNLTILWDTGEASPSYIVTSINSQLASINNSTDLIRTIWNTLQNNGLLYTKLLKKLDNLPDRKEKDYTKELSKIRELIQGISVPSLIDLEKLLTIRVEAPIIPAPIVNIPKIDIPDYQPVLTELAARIDSLRGMTERIPTELKDYTPEISTLMSKFGDIESSLIDVMIRFHTRVGSDIKYLTEEISSQVKNNLTDKAAKDDISSVLTSVKSISSELNSSIKNVIDVINSLNAGMVSKVKTGYRVAKDSEQALDKLKAQYDRLRTIRRSIG